MKVAPTKIPPLKCPQCTSTMCSRDAYGNIDCEDCGKKTTKKGKVVKTNRKFVAPTRKKNLPEGYFS